MPTSITKKQEFNCRINRYLYRLLENLAMEAIGCRRLNYSRKSGTVFICAIDNKSCCYCRWHMGMSYENTVPDSTPRLPVQGEALVCNLDESIVLFDPDFTGKCIADGHGVRNETIGYCLA